MERRLCSGIPTFLSYSSSCHRILQKFLVALHLVCVTCIHGSLDVPVGYVFLWSTAIFSCRILWQCLHKRSQTLIDRGALWGRFIGVLSAEPFDRRVRMNLNVKTKTVCCVLNLGSVGKTYWNHKSSFINKWLELNSSNSAISVVETTLMQAGGPKTFGIATYPVPVWKLWGCVAFWTA